MTCLEAMGQADSLVPNAVAQDRKLAWLQEAEGLLRDTILPGEVPSLTLTAQLRLPEPWSGYYVHYLAMQLHYVHGETDRYNQANAICRALWNGFRDHHIRSQLPQGKALRYF